MSGICGVCGTGVEPLGATLDFMLEGLTLAGDTKHDCFVGSSVALGAAQRWESQEIAALESVYLASETDLTNWQDLRTHLQSKRTDASHMSGAEVLAWLYAFEGPQFFKRLEGSFSIALWDEKLQRLLLAIDPLGISRLYFSQEGSRLLFASRPAAVRAGKTRDAEVNPSAIMQFLIFSVVTAPLSIFREIERVRPGFYLQFENGNLSHHRYWDLKYPENEKHDEWYWVKEVREQLRNAVHRTLVDSDPDETGAYLSGGTDSSTVVAFMSERLPSVQSFSISFPVTGFNEIEYARTTAQHFRSRHHELCLSPQDVIDAIPLVMEYYDEPFANSSALASYRCALLAKEKGINTLLAGDGGDELFAGNERYATDRRFAQYQFLPQWFRRGILEPATRLLPEDDGYLSLPKRYIRRASITNPRRLFSYGVFLSEEPATIFDPAFLDQAPPEAWMRIAEHHFNGASTTSELNRMMYMDVKIILADNDLRKVSGTAELAGVRVRYPFLDRRLVEFSGTIPTGLKMKGSKKRYIFKKAMKGIVPDVVLSKQKHGFGVPIGDWFLNDAKLKSLAQDVLGDPRTRQRGYFRTDFYDRVLTLHRENHAGYYGEVIWYLVALELWHRLHLQRSVRRSLRAR